MHCRRPRREPNLSYAGGSRVEDSCHGPTVRGRGTIDLQRSPLISSPRLCRDHTPNNLNGSMYFKWLPFGPQNSARWAPVRGTNALTVRLSCSLSEAQPISACLESAWLRVAPELQGGGSCGGGGRATGYPRLAVRVAAACRSCGQRLRRRCGRRGGRPRGCAALLAADVWGTVITYIQYTLLQSHVGGGRGTLALQTMSATRVLRWPPSQRAAPGAPPTPPLCEPHP